MSCTAAAAKVALSVRAAYLLKSLARYATLYGSGRRCWRRRRAAMYVQRICGLIQRIP